MKSYLFRAPDVVFEAIEATQQKYDLKTFKEALIFLVGKGYEAINTSRQEQGVETPKPSPVGFNLTED